MEVWDSTLVDQGQGPLTLRGTNTTIQLATARMEVDGGAGMTLISEGTAGQNDYIDVQNAGQLNYLGKGGVTDTFTAPVLVENGGNFSLDGGGGGTLAINGKEQGTNNVSLYCAGGLTLANGITLKASNGINATSISIVATVDTSTCTIAVASGNPCVMDGLVQIDAPGETYNTYGTLVVDCDTLDFDGTLVINCKGDPSGICDELVVNGALNLEGDSTLNVGVDGTDYVLNETWVFITSTGGGIGQFANVNISGIGGAVVEDNEPSAGDDELWFRPSEPPPN